MNEVIERCLNHKLSIYSYFILHYLYNEEPDVIVNYCRNVDLITTKDFLWLADKGWIEPLKNRNEINIEDLVLTDKFQVEVLRIVKTKGLTFDQAFEQLRDHYPSKAGNTERRLQGEVERCKRLYHNTITKGKIVDEELHSVILQCINYEIKAKTKDRSLDYFQLLATWLNKRTWELYKNDVEKIIKRDGYVERGSDNNENFTSI